VQPAIKDHLIWRLEASISNGIKELLLRWCDALFWWWRPRTAEDVGEISH
jgi:hypothetical protein